MLETLIFFEFTLTISKRLQTKIQGMNWAAILTLLISFGVVGSSLLGVFTVEYDKVEKGLMAA